MEAKVNPVWAKVILKEGMAGRAKVEEWVWAFPPATGGPYGSKKCRRTKSVDTALIFRTWGKRWDEKLQMQHISLGRSQNPSGYRIPWLLCGNITFRCNITQMRTCWYWLYTCGSSTNDTISSLQILGFNICFFLVIATTPKVAWRFTGITNIQVSGPILNQ